jgi:hypothetical protein
MTPTQRLRKQFLRLHVPLLEEGEDAHVVLVGDLVSAGEGMEFGEIGNRDTADEVAAEGGRVELGEGEGEEGEWKRGGREDVRKESRERSKRQEDVEERDGEGESAEVRRRK